MAPYQAGLPPLRVRKLPRSHFCTVGFSDTSLPPQAATQSKGKASATLPDALPREDSQTLRKKIMISAFGRTGKTQGPSPSTEFGIRSVDDSFLRGPHITSFQIAKPGLNTWVSITSKTTESQSILENSHSQGLHELPVIPSLAADRSSHRITIVPKLQILTVEEFMLIQPSEVQERSVSSFSGVRGRTLDKLKTKQQAVKNGVSYETCSTLSYKSWFRKHFTSNNGSHIQLVVGGKER